VPFEAREMGCRVPGWRGGMRRTHRGPALTVSSGIFLTVARVLLSHVSMLIDVVLAAAVRAQPKHTSHGRCLGGDVRRTLYQRT
jgi:hypothetical protein